MNQSSARPASPIAGSKRTFAANEEVGDVGGEGRKKRRNVGRRDHRRGTRPEARQGSPGENVEAGNGEKKTRLPKRPCAVLLGFCGTGCNGMQIQPNVRTVEGVLFEAMVKAGAVSADNSDDPVKVGLKRAARTDAGVHAAGNVISMKLITAVPGVPDMVARINEELPPEIRVWSFIRTQNSFNAHTSCDSRMYTYIFPSYILLPPKPDSGLARALNVDADPPEPAKADAFWADASSVDDTVDDDLRRKRAWRVGPERMEALRLAASKYLGSHNFHNFTVGRDFSDRSNQRFMKKIEVQDPVVYDNTEWIPILFHGQSFMLHQRKMVCALVFVCRTGTPPGILNEMFCSRKVVVPKAPALGLLLEQPIFGGYNKKVMEANASVEPHDPKFRAPIDFEVHRGTIERFKRDQIYSRIRAQESKEAIFDAWIRSIDSYSGSDLNYLNARGVIPPAAVLNKGERRPNPFRDRKRFDTGGLVAGVDAAQVEEDDDDDDDEEDIGVDKLADMEG